MVSVLILTYLRKNDPKINKLVHLNSIQLFTLFYTVVGDYIITMKTTFDLNFDIKLLNSIDTFNHKTIRSCRLKNILFDCKLVIRKKPVNNQNLNKEDVFIVFI